MIRTKAVISGVTGLPGLQSVYFTGASITPTAAECSDAVARVRAFWVALAGQMASGCTIQVQQQLDWLDPVTGALLGRPSASSPPASVVATGTGISAPAIALGLKLVTAQIVNGRLLQGRMFISPLATTAVTAGIPSTAATTAGTNALAALNGSTTPILPSVWHRPPPHSSSGAAYAVVSTAVDSAKMWVLRSRRD